MIRNLLNFGQVGDEAVMQLLLKTNIDVNDADAEGNSALHWTLKLSRSLCPQQIKSLSLSHSLTYTHRCTDLITLTDFCCFSFQNFVASH